MADSNLRNDVEGLASPAFNSLPEIRCLVESCIDATGAAERAARFCRGVHALTPDACVALVLHDQGDTFVHAVIHAARPAAECDAFGRSALQSFIELTGMKVRPGDAAVILESRPSEAQPGDLASVVQVPLIVAGRIRGLLFGSAGPGEEPRIEATWYLASECFGPALLALERLDAAVLVEPLTRIGNRRRLDQELDRHLGLLQRYGTTFSLVLLDVDRFKQINDNHGHPMGDRVLQDIARTLASQIRTGDILCRHGGDEFSILLPHTDEIGTNILSRRLQNAAENASFGPSGRDLRVSISTGSVTVQEADERCTSSQVFAEADRALYAAKAARRTDHSQSQTGRPTDCERRE